VIPTWNACPPIIARPCPIAFTSLGVVPPPIRMPLDTITGAVKYPFITSVGVVDSIRTGSGSLAYPSYFRLSHASFFLLRGRCKTLGHFFWMPLCWSVFSGAPSVGCVRWPFPGVLCLAPSPLRLLRSRHLPGPHGPSIHPPSPRPPLHLIATGT